MVVKSARVARSLGKDVLLVSQLGEPFQFATAGPVLAIQIPHFGYDFSEIHSQFILDAAGSRKDLKVMYRAAAKTVSRCNIVGLVGLGALGLGSAIYILFRPRSLLMFSWFDWMGLGALIDSLRSEWHGFAAHLPDALLGSAPFALWVLAYMLLIEAIWAGERTLRKAIWQWIVPGAAVGAELGQLSRAVPGTFDHLDLIAIFTAVLSGKALSYGLRLRAVSNSCIRARKICSACALLLTALLVAGSEQRATIVSSADTLLPPPSDADSTSQGPSGSSNDQQEGQGSQSGQGQISAQGQGISGQQQSAAPSDQETDSSQQPDQGDQGSGGSGQSPGDTQSAQGSASSSAPSRGSNAQSRNAAPGGMPADDGTDASPSQQPQGNQHSPQQGGAAQPQGIAPAGSNSGPGGSSPFATNNSSPGVPRLDPVTGGYVVTPAQGQGPVEVDPQQAPQRAPNSFPDFR